MSYEVRLRGSTTRDLRRMAPEQVDAILARIEELSLRPRPAASKDLQGPLQGLRSLRVGDYRVAYVIREDLRSVEVWQVGHRRDFYKRLTRLW